MDPQIDFTALYKFLSLVECDAQRKEALDCNAFKKAEGSILSSLLEEFQDRMIALRHLKMLSETLAGLSRFVEEGLKTARKELCPEIYNRGIFSLPFEVMAHIFEFLKDTGYDTDLQWTCRYFRDIALKVPQIWSRISTDRDPRLSLERSGAQKLHVTVDQPPKLSKSYEAYFNRIEPHHERWMAFRIRHIEGTSVLYRGYPLYEILELLRDRLEGRAFPNLETLDIDYADDFATDPQDPGRVVYNDGDPDATLRSFFSTWSMPALKRVRACAFIPMLPATCLQNVTSVSLSFYEDPCSLPIISKFLRSLPSLEDLSLNIWSKDSLPGDEDEDEAIEVPRVKSLRVSAGLSDRNNKRLVQAISAPKLQELSLYIARSVETASSIRFAELLFSSKGPRWPHLQSLNIQCHGDDVVLHKLCINLPPLHHLSIDKFVGDAPTAIAMYSSSGRLSRRSYPPLRKLTLSNCDTRFVNSLIAQHDYMLWTDEFKTLEIKGWTVIDPNLIRSLMPKDKELVYYRPY